MNSQTETVVGKKAKLLPLGLAGLCLALATGGGLVYYCTRTEEPPGQPAPHAGPPPDPAEAKTPPGKPELLLTTSRQDTQILAIDFYGVRDRLRSMAPEDRKNYILQECLKLYVEDRAAARNSIPKARLYALYVPDRDEYAKGSFRNLTELAIIDTTRESAAAQDKPLSQRVGQVEWKNETDAP